MFRKINYKKIILITQMLICVYLSYKIVFIEENITGSDKTYIGVLFFIFSTGYLIRLIKQ